MRFALMIEAQQGLSYAEQLAVARRAEAAGFEAMFRSVHYESFPGDTDAPTTDAWAVVAGLARDTDRIGLGVLVSPVGFRTPGNLAKVVVTVDEMSGGRIEMGVGAGWHDAEHRRHGFPFPDIAESAERLEETLEISTACGKSRRLCRSSAGIRGRGRPIPPAAGLVPGPRGTPADPRRRVG